MEEEIKYAALVVSMAQSAVEGSETKEQAIDLLSDACALLLSETDIPTTQAFERISSARHEFGSETADLSARMQ